MSCYFFIFLAVLVSSSYWTSIGIAVLAIFSLPSFGTCASQLISLISICPIILSCASIIFLISLFCNYCSLFIRRSHTLQQTALAFGQYILVSSKYSSRHIENNEDRSNLFFVLFLLCLLLSVDRLSFPNILLYGLINLYSFFFICC